MYNQLINKPKEQIMTQHAKIYLEDIKILRDVSTVTKNVYMALCYYFKQVEEDGYRIRSTKVSLTLLSDITGYSYGSIKRAVAQLKKIHFITDGKKEYIYNFEKRFGRSSLITVRYPVGTEVEFFIDKEEKVGPHVKPQEGTHVKPSTDEKVKPTMGPHVKPSVGTHVKPSVGLHVKPSINKSTNSNYNKSINTTSVNQLSEKQIYIIKRFCKQFKWKHNDFENELNSLIPSYAFEYLDNALIYIGIWNYQKQLEDHRHWTSNYWIKGIIGWLERGKPKKPNPKQEELARKLHSEVIQFEPKKPTPKKPDLKIVEHTPMDDLAKKQIDSYKEDNTYYNKIMLESFLSANISDDLKDEIKRAIAK